MEALRFATELCGTLDDPDSPLAVGLGDRVLEFVGANLSNAGLLRELCGVLRAQVSNGVCDPFRVCAALSPLIGDPAVAPDVQLSLLVPLDCALCHRDFLASVADDGDAIVDLIERYFRLSALLFRPGDSLCLSDVDVFRAVSVALCDCEEYADFLLGNLDGLYAAVETRAGLLAAVTHALGRGSDAIADSLGAIASLFARAACDPVRMVREAAALGISALADACAGQVDDHVEELVGAVLASLAADGAPEMFLALADLLDAAHDTDPVFETVYGFLIARMAAAIQRQWVFPCVRALCRNAPRSARAHFDELLPLFSGLTAEQDLAEDAIAALCRLAHSCQEQFAPHAADLAQYLWPFLRADDPRARGIGLQNTFLLFEAQAPQLGGMLPELVPLMLDMGRQVIDLREETHAVLQALERGDEEDGDDQPDDSISYPAQALRIAALVAKSWPADFAPHLQTLVDGLVQQLQLHSALALDAACDAIELTCEAAAKCGASGPDIAASFAPPALALALDTPESDLAAKAFAVVGDVVHFFSADALGDNLPPLLHALLRVFEEALPCQSGDWDFDESLRPAVASLIRELIVSLDLRALSSLAPVVPALTALVRHRSRSLRSFALEQLGQFVETVGNHLPPEFLADVLGLAVDGVREESAAAALVLSQFASGAPSALAPHVGTVLELLRTKLVAPPRRAREKLEFRENVVAAVAEIQRTVLCNDFPVEQFLLPSIRSMPAVADRTVNKEMFLFWLWLADRTELEPANEFAEAGVRLLGMNDDEMGEHLTGSDVPIVENVAKAVAVALGKVRDPHALIADALGGDVFRIERVTDRINQVGK
jgi:hypothetical protein